MSNSTGLGAKTGKVLESSAQTEIFYFILFLAFLSFLFLLYFALQYCIGFAIHWHESATGIHELPILNPLPPPTPYHLSGSSPCTSPKHPVSCIEHRLAICFLHDSVHVSVLFSQIIPPSVHQGCILSPCLFNLYAEYIKRNSGLEEAQAGNKIIRRNINNLRYADDTPLMAENEEELKSLLKMWKRKVKKLA